MSRMDMQNPNPTSLHIGMAPRASLAMGAAGALVGGSIATAKNIRKVKEESITKDEAVKDILKESATTGIATAIGTAAVSMVGLRGTLSLLGLLSVTIGVKYLADKTVSDKKA
ncbi:hypothetical protein OOT00_08760 [Desulfobotulus sp. H1]|uniref:Uncharacterized protein n=1 Tax=Desulfobotulus pelophilus TaxID=2823377 RepID=A0ABT3N9D3_9BACT|nr:hypothetical protein [Desulfobotulus pelophilus]MCW7754076.1 hypothetical protein [Desulfobotulus pelophilus]